MTTRREFFATAPKGLEPLLASELSALGAAEAREMRAGVAFSVPTAPITLAAGESTTLRVTVRTAQGAPRREAHGWLTLSGAGELAHAALYTLIR